MVRLPALQALFQVLWQTGEVIEQEPLEKLSKVALREMVVKVPLRDLVVKALGQGVFQKDSHLSCIGDIILAQVRYMKIKKSKKV